MALLMHVQYFQWLIITIVFNCYSLSFLSHCECISTDPALHVLPLLSLRFYRQVSHACQAYSGQGGRGGGGGGWSLFIRLGFLNFGLLVNQQGRHHSIIPQYQ